MAITAEAFFEMVRVLDKDGDGEVSRQEYEDVYRTMFPNVTHERFLAVWHKMDANGDGNLTVQELADFYGFDIEAGLANEMTDEQILEALQLMSAMSINAVEKSTEVINESVKGSRVPVIGGIGGTVKIDKSLDQAKQDAISFMEACQMGDMSSNDPSTPTVQKFLNLGVTTRIQDTNSEMPIHKLARFNQRDANDAKNATYRSCLESLVLRMQEEAAAIGPYQFREDINHRERNGKTPLYLAVEHKNIVMLETLFNIPRKDGPDPLVTNSMGWTVLHAAVQADDLPTLKALIQFITPTRITLMLSSLSRTGRNPLHVSAYHSQPEVVKVLLELGADKKQLDCYGNTAGKLAEKAGRKKSKELIDGQTDSFKRMLLQRQGSNASYTSTDAASPLPIRVKNAA